MAIGTVAAIGLGLAGAGAAAGAISSNSASKRAASTSQQNTETNTALAREIYGNNQQVLSPFVNRGHPAGNQINALLGLGGPQPAAPATAAVQPNALSQFQGSPSAASYYGLGDNFMGISRSQMADAFPQMNNRLEQLNPSVMGGYNPTQNNMANGAVATAQPQGQSTQGQTAQGAAENAFDIFRNSTGYQFRLGEGLDAINSGYAGAGTLQSGAAMRGINEYGQNFASNEFGNYMNALGAQQAVGAGSASSLAGVGQNFAGTVINSNNANAANQMNAQLSRQNALGNAAGILGGGLFQYGMGG